MTVGSNISQLNVAGNISQLNISGSILLVGAGINWDAYWLTRTPSQLTLSSLSDSSIKLDWTNAITQDYDGIAIERSVDGLIYTEIDIVNPTDESFIDVNLTPNTLYYYRIRAFKL